MRELLVPGRNQCGAVIIEFALVFVLFFMVMYGVVAYGAIFALQHSLTLAASEGARAAVKDVGALEQRIDLAKKTASDTISWLGGNAPIPQVTSDPCASTAFTCLKVVLVYDYAKNPLLPGLPGLGVSLPNTLSAQATVQLDAVSTP